MQESQVRELSREQAQEMLLELMRQLMIKDNVIRHLMKSAL
jgi:ribosomal protein S6